MQPLCQKDSAGIVEEKKPHFLGVWEHRGVKIELYEDGEQLPFAILIYQDNTQRTLASHQIRFGVNGLIQGAELVKIIKEISQSILNGELEEQRRCAAILTQDAALYFLLPLMGGGGTPHDGGFVAERDDFTLWPTDGSPKVPTTLHHCKNAFDLAYLWKNTKLSEVKKQCEELAHKLIDEYREKSPKQKHHVLEILPLASLETRSGVPFALLQAFSTDLGDEKKLENPFVTNGLAAFIRLAPKDFLEAQAQNLKIPMFHLCKRVSDMSPASHNLLSSWMGKTAPPPKPNDLLAALEAVSQIADAIADVKLSILSTEDKQQLGDMIDNLEDHPDFRVRMKAAYIHQALLRIPGQEPENYLLLCKAARALLVVDKLAAGVMQLNVDQVVSSLGQIPSTLKQAKRVFDTIGAMKAIKEKGQSWYSQYRACEFYLLTSKFDEFDKFLKKIEIDPDEAAFPGSLLLLYRSIVQTHPRSEVREKCVAYIGALLDEKKWGVHPDLKKEVVMTLAAIQFGNSPPLSAAATRLLKSHHSTPSSVTGMTLLEPLAQFPAYFFEGVKRDHFSFCYSLLEESSSYKLEKDGYLELFPKVIPLSLKTKEKLLDRAIRFLTDPRKNYLVVQGSHGCGKTLFCRYLERYLWENFDKYLTIPLYLSLRTIKSKEALQRAIKEIFEETNCIRFLHHAKTSSKVLLIVDHLEELPHGGQLTEDCELSNWKNLKVIAMRNDSQNIFLEKVVPIVQDVPQLSKLDKEIIGELTQDEIKSYAEKFVDQKDRPAFLSFIERPEMSHVTKVYLHLYLLKNAYGECQQTDLFHLIKAFTDDWLKKHKIATRNLSFLNLPLQTDPNEEFYRFMEASAWYAMRNDAESLRGHIESPGYSNQFWHHLTMQKEFPLCRIEKKGAQYTCEFPHIYYSNFFLASLFVRSIKACDKQLNDNFLTHVWRNYTRFPFENIKDLLINKIQEDIDFQDAIVNTCSKITADERNLPLFLLQSHVPETHPSRMKREMVQVVADEVEEVEVEEEEEEEELPPPPPIVRAFERSFIPLPYSIVEREHIPPRPQQLVVEPAVNTYKPKPHRKPPKPPKVYKRPEIFKVVLVPDPDKEIIDLREYSGKIPYDLLTGEKIRLNLTYEGELILSPRTLFLSDVSIRCFKFTPCGRFIAYGAADKLLHVCSIDKKREIKTLSHPVTRIDSLAFSPDGQWLATGSKDLHLINMEDSDITLLKADYTPTALLFTENSSLVIVGRDNGGIALWKWERGAFNLKSEIGQGAKITHLAWVEETKRLASVNSLGVVCLWSVDPNEGSLTCIAKYPCNGIVASLTFYRSHSLIIKTENEIIVFNCKKMAVRSTTPHKMPFINQTKRSGNTLLAAGILDNRLAVWEAILKCETNEEQAQALL